MYSSNVVKIRGWGQLIAQVEPFDKNLRQNNPAIIRVLKHGIFCCEIFERRFYERY